MKKVFLALLITALVTGGAFAQVSAGIGGGFIADFTNYWWTDDAKKAMEASGSSTDSYDTNLIGGGVYGFFDATYVMVSLGVSFLDMSPANSDLKKAQKDAKYSISATSFDIGLYGKIPIELGGFTLFPTIGVDFRVALDAVTNADGEKTSAKDFYNENDESFTEWNSSVWVKLGIGADFPLGERMYLRSIVLAGLGTNTKLDKEELKNINDPTKILDSIVNSGWDIKLALGFKF